MTGDLGIFANKKMNILGAFLNRFFHSFIDCSFSTFIFCFLSNIFSFGHSKISLFLINCPPPQIPHFRFPFPWGNCSLPPHMIVFPPFSFPRQHLFPIIFGPFFDSIYSHNLAAFPNHIFSIFPVLFLFKMGRQFLLFAFLLSLLLVGIYAQGVCVHQGKQYRNGDEWTYRSFIMRCDVYHNYWQTKVVACLSLMGQRIPVGGQIQDRHGVWKCIQDPSGSTRLVQE